MRAVLFVSVPVVGCMNPEGRRTRLEQDIDLYAGNRQTEYSTVNHQYIRVQYSVLSIIKLELDLLN